jgi:hypothetical protein
MRPLTRLSVSVGAIAQLGERLHGMQEVSGSIPLSSTNLFSDWLETLLSNKKEVQPLLVVSVVGL